VKSHIENISLEIEGKKNSAKTKNGFKFFI